MTNYRAKYTKSSGKQIFKATATIIAALITLAVVYLAVNRENISFLSPEGRPEAVSASCRLNLTLNRPTSTPRSTPGVCQNCQYQADIFWGPLIESFAGGARYSTGGRLIRAASNLSGFPGCVLQPVSSIPAPQVPALSTECANPVSRGILTGTIDTSNVNLPEGYITATITNNSNTCSYPVGLAVYKANGSNVEIQNLFDHSLIDLPSKESRTLVVKSPMNNDAPNCHQIPPICSTVTPYDPPRGICSRNGTTGSAFWEWRHVEATEYEVDIYRADGTLFIDNGWQPLSAFNNCQIGKCNYVTNNMPLGSYYSRIRARNTTACTASNWHQSITITVARCTGSELELEGVPSE